MVKFDLVLTDGRIHVETIDDAEGTPGSSRQYTRFNAECKPELDAFMATVNGNNIGDQETDLNILRILIEHNFEKRDVVLVKDADGKFAGRIRMFVDSVEP